MKTHLNTDAERKAIEIRCRAERRAGQLLKEMAAKGQRATQSGSGIRYAARQRASGYPRNARQ
ncbi:hypothetical protein [Paraburkholderia elongata]|uniref:Uncharacterized protein n=1 Tax=Paraburkholderia elongata TaxID=2675747 RepID=A0A972P128_9BURK|nr:hypothetical protein [Paraburkholderia elongata]NPT61205.1 hypothetical protein [Paraburkholderia elongata]